MQVWKPWVFLWCQGSINLALCDKFILQSSPLGPSSAFSRALVIPEKSSVWKSKPRAESRVSSLRVCSGPVAYRSVSSRHKPKSGEQLLFSAKKNWKPGYKGHPVTVYTQPPALPHAHLIAARLHVQPVSGPDVLCKPAPRFTLGFCMCICDAQDKIQVAILLGWLLK